MTELKLFKRRVSNDPKAFHYLGNNYEQLDLDKNAGKIIIQRSPSIDFFVKNLLRALKLKPESSSGQGYRDFTISFLEEKDERIEFPCDSDLQTGFIQSFSKEEKEEFWKAMAKEMTRK